jgi:hypothetical protein
MQADAADARAGRAEEAGKTKAAMELRAEAIRLRGPQTRKRARTLASAPAVSE